MIGHEPGCHGGQSCRCGLREMQSLVRMAYDLQHHYNALQSRSLDAPVPRPRRRWWHWVTQWITNRWTI